MNQWLLLICFSVGFICLISEFIKQKKIYLLLFAIGIIPAAIYQFLDKSKISGAVFYLIIGSISLLFFVAFFLMYKDNKDASNDRKK